MPITIAESLRPEKAGMKQQSPSSQEPSKEIRYLPKPITIGGQLGQAISDFTKAVEIKPEFIEGYKIRGPIYVAMNQYEQAISDFTKVIEYDPDSAETYFRRSLACYANGWYEKAWQDVYKIQGLGLSVPPDFLKILRAASGKQK